MHNTLTADFNLIILSTSLALGATATALAVDNRNFENNIFIDFVPLLALFGDEIAKQFLSTSTGWANDIHLGIAHIRIMTVIIFAIRIGGAT